MLPDDGESVGLDASLLPLAIGIVEGLYPGVGDGGMEDFSCSASPEGMMVDLLMFPGPMSLLVICFDDPGLPKESLLWGRFCSCVLARGDCDVGESVDPRS